MCNDFQGTTLFLKEVDFSERFAKKILEFTKELLITFF